MTAFTPSELDYLSGQRLGRIATSQDDGTLQVSPVTFAYNPEYDSIDIGGWNLTKSKKFRNVAGNGRVAFVVDDLASTDPWRPRYVEIRGQGEAITEQLYGPVIRIHPRRVISMGIDQPDTPAQLLRSNARTIT